MKKIMNLKTFIIGLFLCISLSVVANECPTTAINGDNGETDPQCPAPNSWGTNDEGDTVCMDAQGNEVIINAGQQ